MTEAEFDRFADDLREKLLGSDSKLRGFAIMLLSEDDKESETIRQLAAFGTLNQSEEYRWALIDSLFDFADKLDDAFPRPRQLDAKSN